MAESERLPVWRNRTLFLVTAAGVILCLVFMHTLLFPLTGAVALAVVLHKPRLWLLQRMGASTCSFLLLTAITIAVVLPSVLVVHTAVIEAIQASRYISSGQAADDIHQFSSNHHKIGPWMEQGLDQLAPDQEGKRVAGMAAGWMALGLRNVATGIFHIVIMLFLLFFLLRDAETAHDAMLGMLPLPEHEARPFLKRLGEVTHAIFLGRFLIAGIQGMLSGLAYLLLGVPGALLWGAITAIMCLVPAFGAFLVWVPITIYLLLSAGWVKALIMAVWGGIVVSNLDNVLYPALVGRRTDLHTAVIFVSVFGGLALFGFAGFVLGPVIVAATMLLIQNWKHRMGTAEELH